MEEGVGDGWSSIPYGSTNQIFETERYFIAELTGYDVRNLMSFLLQDELLCARIDWMTDTSRDSALREAFGIELLCNAGQGKVWTIIDRAKSKEIGAVFARHSRAGLDVQVLVASRFWDQDVSEEASAPVVEWLEENIGESDLRLQ